MSIIQGQTHADSAFLAMDIESAEQITAMRAAVLGILKSQNPLPTSEIVARLPEDHLGLSAGFGVADRDKFFLACGHVLDCIPKGALRNTASKELFKTVERVSAYLRGDTEIDLAPAVLSLELGSLFRALADLYRELAVLDAACNNGATLFQMLANALAAQYAYSDKGEGGGYSVVDRKKERKLTSISESDPDAVATVNEAESDADAAPALVEQAKAMPIEGKSTVETAPALAPAKPETIVQTTETPTPQATTQRAEAAQMETTSAGVVEIVATTMPVETEGATATVEAQSPQGATQRAEAAQVQTIHNATVEAVTAAAKHNGPETAASATETGTPQPVTKHTKAAQVETKIATAESQTIPAKDDVALTAEAHTPQAATNLRPVQATEPVKKEISAAASFAALPQSGITADQKPAADSARVISSNQLSRDDINNIIFDGAPPVLAKNNMIALVTVQAFMPQASAQTPQPTLTQQTSTPVQAAPVPPTQTQQVFAQRIQPQPAPEQQATPAAHVVQGAPAPQQSILVTQVAPPSPTNPAKVVQQAPVVAATPPKFTATATAPTANLTPTMAQPVVTAQPAASPNPTDAAPPVVAAPAPNSPSANAVPTSVQQTATPVQTAPPQQLENTQAVAPPANAMPQAQTPQKSVLETKQAPVVESKPANNKKNDRDLPPLEREPARPRRQAEEARVKPSTATYAQESFMLRQPPPPAPKMDSSSLFNIVQPPIDGLRAACGKKGGCGGCASAPTCTIGG